MEKEVLEKLHRIGGMSWYIEGRTKVGVYQVSDDEVYLIDTGRPGMVEMVDQVIDAMGWKVRGILCTHAHSDHIGGNAFFQKKHGCPIYCSEVEAAVISNTELEAALVYGSYPFAEMRDSGFMPDEADCLSVEDPSFPEEVEVIALPGHSIAQIGFRLPDGTICLGDSICGKWLLEHRPFTYLYNVERYLDTLERLKSMEGNVFLPSHGELCEEIAELAQDNIDNIYRVRDVLLSFVEVPKGIEEILKNLMDYYGMHVSFDQYSVSLYILRGYISWMKDTGVIEPVFEDNRLLWRSTNR